MRLVLQARCQRGRDHEAMRDASGACVTDLSVALRWTEPDDLSPPIISTNTFADVPAPSLEPVSTWMWYRTPCLQVLWTLWPPATAA